MVGKSNATVVPVFFDGHTSRLFQIASHLHVTLRMGLLIKEFKARVDTPVRVCVGQPLPQAELAKHAGDSRQMMQYLREQTYALSPVPMDLSQGGFEFEKRYKN